MKLSLVKVYLMGLLACLVVSSCKKDDNSKNSINTYSLTVQNQLNGSRATAMSLVNLTEGKVYNSTEAKDHQNRVDFAYQQYTGTAINKDSYFYSINYLKTATTGYEQEIRDELGIQSWTTITESIMTQTDDVTAAEFDAIDNAADLQAAYSRVDNGQIGNEAITDINGQPISGVFAFRAANNKIGLMKLKAARTGTGGGIDIDVKVQK